MIGKKTLLRCFVGTLTCVAVVVSGWDAEAGHRRRCRRACCPTTCCMPVCDPCCVTTCAPVCDPCCTTTCSNGACTTTYVNGCCYNSCFYTVSAPVICCVADAASSPSTAAVASKSGPPATKAAKAVPVSTGSVAAGR